MLKNILLLFLVVLTTSCVVDPLSNYEKRLLLKNQNTNANKTNFQYYPRYDSSEDNPYYNYEDKIAPPKKYIYYPRYDSNADNPTYPQYEKKKPAQPAYKYPRYDSEDDNPSYAVPNWKNTPTRPSIHQPKYKYPRYDSEADNPTSPAGSMFSKPLFTN